MTVSARAAADEDLTPIVGLYRGLEHEMMALHPMWPRMDGLSEPVGEAMADALSDGDSVLLVGEIDGFPLGFLLAKVRLSLPQADFERVGSIDLVYTDPEAREVGVAEAMRDLALETLRRKGISKFDARVLPGHRLAKNFFEAGGFSARSIIMHHDDHPTERPARDPRRY